MLGRGIRNTAAVLAGAAVLLTAAVQVRANPIEDFYKGKSISIILFSTTGSAYDTYSRLLAKFMPKHVPGQPAMLVKSMPGAGGILAARHLAEVAPRDGTNIGALSKTLIFEPLLGDNTAKIDFLKFGWLGSMSQSTAIYVSAANAKVKTAQDLFEHELMIPATGAASETTIVTRALIGILGVKFKLVDGYSGSGQAMLALERGEVDGAFPTLEALSTTRPTWIAEKKINLLFQTRQVPDPQIAHVPSVITLARNETQRKALEFMFPKDVIGRPFGTPPEVPADRLAALQKAFDAAVSDPELLEEAKKIRVPIELTRGEYLGTVIRETYAASPEIIEIVRKAIAGK